MQDARAQHQRRSQPAPPSPVCSTRFSVLPSSPSPSIQPLGLTALEPTGGRSDAVAQTTSRAGDSRPQIPARASRPQSHEGREGMLGQAHADDVAQAAADSPLACGASPSLSSPSCPSCDSRPSLFPDRAPEPTPNNRRKSCCGPSGFPGVPKPQPTPRVPATLLEYWNAGILEYWEDQDRPTAPLPLPHHSTIPPFQSPLPFSPCRRVLPLGFLRPEGELPARLPGGRASSRKGGMMEHWNTGTMGKTKTEPDKSPTPGTSGTDTLPTGSTVPTPSTVSTSQDPPPAGGVTGPSE